MSENEGESRSVGAFLLGFLTGVLVCIGVGGGFFVVAGRQSMREAERARMMAEEARAEAEEQRMRAEMEHRRALDEAKKAREAAEKVKEKAGKAP